jgi:hypothetical protein
MIARAKGTHFFVYNGAEDVVFDVYPATAGDVTDDARVDST